MNEWEKKQGPAVTWTPLNYESFISADGSTLKRDGEAISSSGAKPDKDTYIITASTSLAKITALRLDALSHQSLPQKGPGVRTMAISRSARSRHSFSILVPRSR